MIYAGHTLRSELLERYKSINNGNHLGQINFMHIGYFSVAKLTDIAQIQAKTASELAN